MADLTSDEPTLLKDAAWNRYGSRAAAFVVAALLGLGLMFLLLGHLPVARLLEVGDRLAADGDAAVSLEQELLPFQRRAAALGWLYLVAGMTTLVFRRAVAGRLATLGRDAIAQWRALQKGSAAWVGRETWTAVVLGLATLGFAVLSLTQLNQPIRTDEAATYLNYGTRSPLLALISYGTTNNHMLHSLLMRGSVAVLGGEPWAIRLPAWLAGLTLVPLTFAAAQVWSRRGPALLAAVGVGVSLYLADFATNARGYTLITGFTLLALALRRPLEAGSPAAWAAVAGCAALGLWTVPVMLLPLAIVVVALGLRALQLEPARRRAMLWNLGWAGALAAGLTLLFYSPALAATGLAKVARPDSVRENAQLGLGRTLVESLEVLWLALNYCLYPMPAAMRWVAWLVVGLGWAAMIWRGGVSRAAAVAAVLGPLGVLVAVGSVVPLWSWSFFLPLVMWGLAAGVGVLLERVPGGRLQEPRRAGLCAAVLVLGLGVSGWSMTQRGGELPWTIGYGDAENVAAWLAPRWRDGEGLTGPAITLAPTRYYLSRRGISHHRSAEAIRGRGPGSAWPQAAEQVYLIRPPHMDITRVEAHSGSAREALEAAGFRMVESHRVADSQVAVYRRGAGQPGDGGASPAP